MMEYERIAADGLAAYLIRDDPEGPAIPLAAPPPITAVLMLPPTSDRGLPLASCGENLKRVSTLTRCAGECLLLVIIIFRFFEHR